MRSFADNRNSDTDVEPFIGFSPGTTQRKLTVNTKLRCTKVTVEKKKKNAGSVCGAVEKFPNVTAVLTLKMTCNDYLKKVPRLSHFRFVAVEKLKVGTKEAPPLTLDNWKAEF